MNGTKLALWSPFYRDLKRKISISFSLGLNHNVRLYFSLANKAFYWWKDKEVKENKHNQIRLYSGTIQNLLCS